MPSPSVMKLEWFLNLEHLPPVVKSTLQATALSALSNILAQVLKVYRTGSHLHLDFAPIFQFALYTFLNTPPNVLWQQFLESKYPGYTLQPRVEKVHPKPTPEETEREEEDAEEKAAQDEWNRTGGGKKRTASSSNDPAEHHHQHQAESKERQSEEHKEREKGEWTEELRVERRLDLRNTGIKLALDQTVGAGINTILFVAAMAAMRGASGDKVWSAVKTDCLQLMLAGYKLWPMVSFLSFTVVPVQSRVVFGSVIGVGWGIFLSLFTAH